MKLRKPSKEELKAKAKKYAPYVQAVVSVAATAVAAYYMREANSSKKQLDYYLAEDETAWPAVEITPNVMKDVLAGATMQLRMFHTDEPRTVVQMTSREEGFPAEADEAFAKGTPGEGPRI